MARKSRAEKAEAHERIVRGAARSIRSNGLCATTIPRVMAEAGLTVGAFFRHFPSREALIGAAFAQAVDDLLSPVEAGDSTPQSFLETYLSAAHVENPEMGCPVASLGLHAADVASGSGPAIADAISRLETIVAASAERRTAPGREAFDPAVKTAVALMVGAILVARGSPMTPPQLARFLNECRQALPRLAAGAAQAGTTEHG